MSLGVRIATLESQSLRGTIGKWGLSIPRITQAFSNESSACRQVLLHMILYQILSTDHALCLEEKTKLET